MEVTSKYCHLVEKLGEIDSFLKLFNHSSITEVIKDGKKPLKQQQLVVTSSLNQINNNINDKMKQFKKNKKKTSKKNRYSNKKK